MINGGARGERGEYNLTDALMRMIKMGVQIRTHEVDNWFDCGKKETLLETNRILLERIKSPATLDFPNTVIIQPVNIAPDCQIENAIIGPNVAIASHSVIQNSIVRNSILGAYSQLDSIVLDGSVIGNDASLKGKSHHVNIGDNTEIDFSI